MWQPVAFIRQTVSSFHTTGAIAPSSRFLAKAMVSSLPPCNAVSEDFKILEVGAGTGAFTAAIAQRLKQRGTLDVYEINPAFVSHLRERFAAESVFSALNGRLRLHEGDILSHCVDQHYDAIVSGLPFNNFSAELVQRFLDHFQKMMKPGGVLTFFEYVAVRRIQQPFVGKSRRERLAQIAAIIEDHARRYEVKSQVVLLNLPLARARHLVFRKPAS